MSSLNKRTRGVQWRILTAVFCIMSLSIFWACATTETAEEPVEETYPMSFQWGDSVYTQTGDSYTAGRGNQFEKMGTWKGYEVYKRVEGAKKEQIGYYMEPVEDDLTTLYIKVGDKFVEYKKEDLNSNI